MPDLNLAKTQDLIEGQNFFIRPVTHEDVEEYYALTRTPKALSPVPFEVMPSREAAWLYLGRYLGRAAGHSAFAVMSKTGRLHGVLYLTIDDHDRKANLSWLFKPVIDLMMEAIELFLSSSSEGWSRRIEAVVEPGRTDAAGMLLKLGFRKEATLKSYIFRKGNYHDVWLFSLLR